MYRSFLAAALGFIAMVVTATAYAVHADLGSSSFTGAQAPAHSQKL